MQAMACWVYEDDIAPKAALSVIRGRAFANLTEQCTRAVNIEPDNSQPDDSYMLWRGQKIIARVCCDMSALMEAAPGPADPHHNTAGVRDVPMRPSKNRKENRIKDCLRVDQTKKGNISRRRVASSLYSYAYSYFVRRFWDVAGCMRFPAFKRPFAQRVNIYMQVPK